MTINLYRMGSVILNRQSKLWLQIDWIFKLTEDYVRHQKSLKILHDFSYKVIRERKEEIARDKLLEGEQQTKGEEGLFVKKKLAFLDLLIEASGDGVVLSTDDIREEVDTFMFEVKYIKNMCLLLVYVFGLICHHQNL